jgi:UDP-N-acetylmuramate-alanine ligase
MQHILGICGFTFMGGLTALAQETELLTGCDTSVYHPPMMASGAGHKLIEGCLGPAELPRQIRRFNLIVSNVINLTTHDRRHAKFR